MQLWRRDGAQSLVRISHCRNDFLTLLPLSCCISSGGLNIVLDLLTALAELRFGGSRESNDFTLSILVGLLHFFDGAGAFRDLLEATAFIGDLER